MNTSLVPNDIARLPSGHPSQRGAGFSIPWCGVAHAPPNPGWSLTPLPHGVAALLCSGPIITKDAKKEAPLAPKELQLIPRPVGLRTKRRT